MRQVTLVWWRNKIVLWTEVDRRSLKRRRLHQRLRWRMEVGWRTVDDSPLIDVLWSSLLLDGSGAVLWQLNYGTYGTFDFVFVVNLVVRLAVVIVG